MEDIDCPQLCLIRIWRHLPNCTRKINKEWWYKFARSTNDTKYNKFEDALKFLWSSKVLGHHAIPCRGTRLPSNMNILRSMLAKDLACSKWLKTFHEVAFAMSYIVAVWICIFLTSHILSNFGKKCSFVCSFWQPYVHNIEYHIVS